MWYHTKIIRQDSAESTESKPKNGCGVRMYLKFYTTSYFLIAASIFTKRFKTEVKIGKFKREIICPKIDEIKRSIAVT